MPMSPELIKLLEATKKFVDSLTPEQKEAMYKAQSESWVRAESTWPKPQFHWKGNVKVYSSYIDYLND